MDAAAFRAWLCNKRRPRGQSFSCKLNSRLKQRVELSHPGLQQSEEFLTLTVRIKMIKCGGPLFVKCFLQFWKLFVWVTVHFSWGRQSRRKVMTVSKQLQSLFSSSCKWVRHTSQSQRSSFKDHSFEMDPQTQIFEDGVFYVYGSIWKSLTDMAVALLNSRPPDLWNVKIQQIFENPSSSPKIAQQRPASEHRPRCLILKSGCPQ